MKIDAKLRDTVPEPEPSQVVACTRLSTSSGVELEALLKCLKRLPWERDRIEPRLWVPVLDHFDVLLRRHVADHRYSAKVTAPDEAVGEVDDTLVVEILRVTELLLQWSEKLRRAYGSLEYVSALLEADNLEVLQAALKLLRLLLKRGRTVDSDLNRRLAPLATSWSPIEPQLTLLRACKPVELPQAPSPDVSVEFRAGLSPRGTPRVECLQVPRATLVQTPLADLVARAVEERQLPEGPCRSELRSRLLVLRALQTTEGRTSLVAVRILALGATLQTSSSFQKYLQAYPGLLSELVELLRHLPEVGIPVAEAATSLLSSLVRERSPHQRQLWQLLQLSAPHGLVCSLVRAILAPPRGNTPAIPPASVEAVLHVFLSCVGVSSTGAPGQSGVIACLLEFTAREGLDWHPAVCLAYRAIEAIIDIINGAATNFFRDLHGQGALAQRLAIALQNVTKHPEVPEPSAEDSPEALAHCWQLRHSFSLQRARVGAILRCVLAGLRAEATRGPGVLRGPLTPLVRNLLAQPVASGAAAFAGASSIVAHLIGDDPSCVEALIENGVIPAFLDSIQNVPELLRAPEVFHVVQTVLGALHLNDTGLKEIREKRSPHPFEVMVKLLADPVAFRTLGGSAELHSALGGTLDEVAQNKQPMRSALVGFVMSGLDDLLERARAYPVWVPPKAGAEVAQDPTQQYAERLAAFGRFLETFLSHNEVASAFAQQGGAARLVEALTMPCLPPLFAQLAPAHALVPVFRVLAQGGHLAEPQPAGDASKPARLVGSSSALEELQKLQGNLDKPLSQMSAADVTQITNSFSLLGTVLSLQAAGHRDIVSLSAVQPRTLAAAATVLQEMTPALVWLFKQCSELGSPPADPYADGSSARDSSTDYATLMRDSYKEKETQASGQMLGSYPAPVVEEILWRTLFSVRHFLVSVVAKPLSLPTRRPNRLSSGSPAALAPAARSAANNFAALCKQLLEIFTPEGVRDVAGQADTEILQKLCYLDSTFDLLFRAHMDEKHHHVRMLCVDRLHKAGFYGKPLDCAARYVLAVARHVSGRPAPGKDEKPDAVLTAMQKCLQSLTQYLDKLTSLKWIKNAPAPPTSLPTSEREPRQIAPPAERVRPPVRTEEAPATEDTGTAEPMTGVEAETPTPAEETTQTTTPPTAPATTPAKEASDEIDPWQLWASISASACKALLPFWQETAPAVVRTYPLKAAVSIVQSFLNILDDSDSRTTTGRQAGSGSGGQQRSHLNEQHAQALEEMGFPRHRVEVALWNTGSSSVQMAMDWLFNHPDAGDQAPTATTATGTESQAQDAATEGASPPSTQDTVGAKLAEALAELRASLLPRLAFMGAHVGEGTALVELATQFAHRAVPLKDGILTSEGAEGESASSPDAIRAANARALLEHMLASLKETSEAFPSGHVVWSASPDIGKDDKERAHCSCAFTLGVSAQLLHHRPLVANLIEKAPAGRMDELVAVTLGLVRNVLMQREAAFPKTWTDAFAQGYTFIFGNMAMPSATPDDLSVAAKPPAWFDAAFVTLQQASENMFLMPLPESLSTTLQPTPPQLSAEVQGELVQACMDTMALFSKAENQGSTIQAVLFLLRELCSIPGNAVRVANYGCAGILLEAGGATSYADGGGLMLLLRLPRSARCPGLLRLVSDICAQLLEDDHYHAQQIEDQIMKLFAGSEAIELRQLFDKLQPWLRTCPQLFEDVLKGICKARTVGEGESSRVELVLAPEAERKHHRPPKSDASAMPQQVLQKLLDHLLWTITLERGYEKLSKQEPEKEITEVANAKSGKKDKGSSSAGAIANSPSSSSTGGNKAEKESTLPFHPLAFPADSLLFVLQNLVSSFPQCGVAFAKSCKDQQLEDMSPGKWEPMAERPAELPSSGVFLAGPQKALPLSTSVKSPLVFLIRKILASNFFANDPSQATLGTLQKVANVLAAFAAKHQDTRSKVLHESISLLKQLANHMEAGGGHLASPRRIAADIQSTSTVSVRKVSGASDLLGDESTAEDGKPTPGAFAAGVSALCELLIAGMRQHSPSPGATTAPAPPAATNTTATPSSTADRPTSATEQAPTGATPQVPTTTAPSVPTVSTAAPSIGFNVAEARNLRSVLCRLLSSVNLYHSDATPAASGIVRCLEHLSRPEFIDAVSGSKGNASGGSRDIGNKSMTESPVVAALTGEVPLLPAGSEDVEMTIADIATTLGSTSLTDDRPMGGEFDEDDSLRTPREVFDEHDMGMAPHAQRDEYSALGGSNDDDNEGDSDGDGPPTPDGRPPHFEGEGEDEGGVGEGSEEGDEEFDDEGEEEEGDGPGDDGQVDDDVAEWDESDGEESEEDGTHTPHGAPPPGNIEEAVSFIVDLGDGRSRVLGRGGQGGVPLNVPNEAADRFFQTLSGLGIPGLTISGRNRGEWAQQAARGSSWGWNGDLDLPGAHPLLTSSSPPTQGASGAPPQQIPGGFREFAQGQHPLMFVDGSINLQAIPPPPAAVDIAGNVAWQGGGSTGTSEGRLGRWDTALAAHLTSLLPPAPAPPPEPAPAPAPPAPSPPVGSTTNEETTSNPNPPTEGEQAAPQVPPVDEPTTEEGANDTAMVVEPPVEEAPTTSEDPNSSAMVVEPPEVNSIVEAQTASEVPTDEPTPMDVDSGMPPIPTEGSLLATPTAESPPAENPSNTATPPTTAPAVQTPARPQGRDYGIEALRTVARSLGVTQEVVMQVAGIDIDVLEGLPPELLDEAVMQQLQDIDYDAIRRVAAQNPPVNAPSTTTEPEPATSPPVAKEDGMEGVTTEVAPPTTGSSEVTPMVVETTPAETPSTDGTTQAPPGETANPPAATEPMEVFQEIDPEVLSALPEDIRAEVLADQARERERFERERAAAASQPPADPTSAQDMDNASFIATLTPELRQEVLLTMTEEQLRTLPTEIQAEAQLVRERAFVRVRRPPAEQEARAPPVQMERGQWRPGRTQNIQVVPPIIHADGRRGPRINPAGQMHQADLIQLLRSHLSGFSSFMRPGGGSGHHHHHQHNRHGHGRERMPVVRPDAKFSSRCEDSTLEQPIEPHHTTTICRLLFLRRALPRALMEKMLFNMAVHPMCREALLRRFLQVIVWQLPQEARGLEFPPRHLYGPITSSSGSSADAAELGALEACGASHVAQQVSSARVLGFLSYLLPRIPQTAEFFTKRICYREIATIVDGPDGDEYRRKKKKADHNNSCMEISMEAPGTDEAAINLLIRHTAPERWPGHSSAGHAQLLLLLLRTLLVPPVPPPATPEARALGTPPRPAATAPTLASTNAPAVAPTTEASSATTEATATQGSTTPSPPAPPSSEEGVEGNTATDSPQVGTAPSASSSATATANAAVLAAAAAWPLKLQVLLTPESAATLCSHLCASPLESGSQSKAASVVAAVLKGPADLQLKACIREELLRQVRDMVGRVEAALNASEDAYGAHLQAAGHESNFLHFLQTLQALCQEVSAASSSPTPATSSSNTPAPALSTAETSGIDPTPPPRSTATASATSSSSTPQIQMTLQGILADAHAEKVWTALDEALVRTVEQWEERPSSTGPQAMELSGGDNSIPESNLTIGGASSSTAEAENKVAPPPLLHGLLPLIEAFFLAHGIEKKEKDKEKEKKGSDPTPAGGENADTSTAGGETPGGVVKASSKGNLMSLVEMTQEEKAALEPKTPICAFGERHRRAVNALVRQAPSLLTAGFAPLMESAPWALDFDNKRHYLRQRLRALRGDSRYDVIRLHVRRSEVFTDSYRQLQMQNGEEMRGKLSVTFIGEEAMDAGGVAREWFKILAREIFNPNYALFSQAGGKACTFHPNKMSYVNPDHLRFFSFIGRIIGKAVFDGHHLEAYFTRSFYKHMLRRKVHPSDMEALDPDYYKNLKWMLDNPIEGVLGHLTFTAESDEFGRVKTVELKPGGTAIPVTDDNKREYIQLMCEHKMTTSVQPQISAFLEGFHELVPPDLISLFDDKELELLISGLPEIDVEDLRRNTDYHNYAEASQQIQWFWKALNDFNKEQKAWFLQFVTGTSQVPLEGFKGLIGMRGPQKFSIHRAEGGERLPTAHTCFNQLDLPEYDNEEVLRRKLFQAVQEAHEGFGFV